MLIGTGVDIIELGRIRSAYERSEAFATRILTENELRFFHSLSASRQVEFLAGRFAAKEAYAKARGTGVGSSLSWRDIDVQRDGAGKPIIVSQDAQETVHVSISHSRDYAVAQVIIERSSC